MPPRRIQPGVEVTSNEGPAGDDANGAYWGRAKVLVKPDTPEAPRGVASEFICTRLANALGLPVPMGEVATDPSNRTVWVSALVQLDGEELAPPDPAELVQAEPDTAAGIFVFDVWVLNGDRNERNFVYHPRVGLWACDHALALGQLYQQSFADLPPEANRPLTYHELRDEPLDPTRLRGWGERVRAVSRSAIERLVREASRRDLISTAERSGIIELLLQRQADIHRLVQRSLPDVNNEASALEIGAENLEGGP